MTLAPSVLQATGRERDGVAAMLARAFADDPAMAFIWPNPATRARRLPRLFRLLFDGDAQTGMRLVMAGGEAATLWRGPGKAKTGTLDLLRQAIPLLTTFGPALGRALRLANAIDEHMPPQPFWYLHIAGCDPAHQGKGLGRRVIHSGLDRAAGRLPCYLETANPANLGFYQSLGFAVTGEWRVPRGGPLFWSMLRAPG